MSGERVRIESRGPTVLRGMDQRFGRDRSPDAADEVLNLVPRADGMLVGTRGSAKFHGSEPGNSFSGTPRGVWGGVLNAREEWLAHGGSTIYRWWKNGWLSVATGLSEETRHGPTQMVQTPAGVVILPRTLRGALPLIFDGERVEDLGYSRVPAAPEPVGPYSKDASGNSTRNNEGYDIDLYKMNDTAQWSQNPNVTLMGYGRVGTTVSTIDSGTATGNGSGALYSGEWSARVQMIDRRGDLSPPSPLSAPVHMDMKLPPTSGTPDSIRMQFAWRVPSGDPKTVGRVLSRTKDMRNSPTGVISYEVRPQTGSVGTSAFATIPDNHVEFFPDNFSDGELLTRTEDVAPIPASTAYAFLLGRSWFGTDSGLLWFSQRGRIGTVHQNDYMTAVGRVQAIVAHTQGVLVLTDKQAVFVREREDSESFVPRALNGVPGCVAGGSAQTLTDGSVVWLSPNGFMRLSSEGAAENIGTLVDRSIKSTLLGRWGETCSCVDHEKQQYTAWVPRTGGALAFVLTLSFGWSLRSDAYEVKDAFAYRGRIFVAGKGRSGDGYGIFYLDADRLSDSGSPPGIGQLLRTPWTNLGEEYRTAPSAVTFEAEGYMSTSLAVQTLRNGALGAPPASHIVSVPDTTVSESRGAWSSLEATGYWEIPGNYTLKAPLYSSGSVQSFAVQIYTTTPVILGWIKMHENKNGNSRGAP
jgi:hypothetical protein